MNQALVLLLIVIGCMVGFGLASNNASAWALAIASVALLASLQISYFIGALITG
jgi:hypothetical protein